MNRGNTGDSQPEVRVDPSVIRSCTAAFLGAAILTGCGQPGPSAQASRPLPAESALPASATASPSPMSSPSLLSGAPAAVAQRAPLPSCGVEIVRRGPNGDEYDQAARECFWNAWEEEGSAEFVTVGLTVEGGTVTTLYRLNETGEIEIFTDWTGDPFGPSPGWTRRSCATLERRTAPAQPGVLFFDGDICGEPVEL